MSRARERYEAQKRAAQERRATQKPPNAPNARSATLEAVKARHAAHVAEQARPKSAEEQAEADADAEYRQAHWNATRAHKAGKMHAMPIQPVLTMSQEQAIDDISKQHEELGENDDNDDRTD